MDYDQILYQVEEGVGLVTLNRPEKLNAMTAQMGAEMGDVMAEADGDDEVRVVVMTGAGHRYGARKSRSRLRASSRSPISCA